MDDVKSTGTPGTKFALPFRIRPRVTPGLRWAPDLAATKTPARTAMAHPHVIIKNPPLLPLVLPNRTLATTPQPSSVSIPVPNTSDRKMVPRDIFDSSLMLGFQPSSSNEGPLRLRCHRAPDSALRR